MHRCFTHQLKKPFCNCDEYTAAIKFDYMKNQPLPSIPEVKMFKAIGA